MSWEAEITGTFRRSYKNLSTELKERADEAILQLLNTDDPTKLELRKVGRWKGVYSYEVGRQFRLLFAVRFEDRVLELLDIGTHKIY